MPDRTAPSHPSDAHLMASVRAVAELRRGGVAIVGDGGNALAVAATEGGLPRQLDRLRKLGAAPRLLLPAARLRGAPDDPGGFHVLAIEPEDDAGWLSDMADPLCEPVPIPPARTLGAPGVLERAAIRLVKLAGLLPGVVAVTPDAALAARENLPSVPVAAPDAHSAAAGRLTRVAEARMPLCDAENTRLICYRPADGGAEHLAILIGAPDPDEPVLTRLHSECFTGDVLGSLRCDCGAQLRGAIAEIAARGKGGVVLYLRQEGRGIGLANKLRAYTLQDRGFDTLDANAALGFDPDERLYRPGAEMLRDLGFLKVRLMTNNPAKLDGLGDWGIEVTARVPHRFPANGHNDFYLETKARRAGHLF